MADDKAEYGESSGYRGLRPTSGVNKGSGGAALCKFVLTLDAPGGEDWTLIAGTNKTGEQTIKMKTADVRKLISASKKPVKPGEGVRLTIGPLTFTVDSTQYTRLQDYLSMFGEV